MKYLFLKDLEQNFYSYINQYRVEVVKTMLANNEQAKYSTVGIGEAAGFNSKSSFYTNFKQYLKKLSKNTFSEW